ncbi:hypothetical protein [Sphingomonas sanxanigenens]|uniref:Uncharacterized protein n=1 Tax=Sphingomonas sanxanigenens DSM 19645 = NX02 TaxID=1123269 RepID=W0AHT8_9SPHN|nr:hypothetical protein [Sphingomonas sanxanigenens]AHE55863.1 hypothetical protein NX02_21120 [Sphingomonas sanxanigenens DSM 19645 = NX02]
MMMHSLIRRPFALAAALGALALGPALPAEVRTVDDDRPGGFEPLAAAAGDAPLCTTDGAWCVAAASEEGEALVVTAKGREVARLAADAETDREAPKLAPMPAILRLKDGSVLVGALATWTAGYSGGGGAYTEQRLVHLVPGRAPVTVLAAPLRGDLLIRACFSEEDVEKRRAACHDEYRLEARLETAGPGAALPPLRLTTKAANFPRGVARDKDSSENPPLTRGDLVWEQDAGCTYERRFRFDAAAGRYVPDAALPACGQYTAP